MRIISGTRRGKKLFAPKNDRIRPTSDRAREALFNILESMLPAPLSEYDFLDVFAGTGAIGLEAASRGARSVTFIDIDLELVKKNAAACRLPGRSFRSWVNQMASSVSNRIITQVTTADAGTGIPPNRGISNAVLF